MYFNACVTLNISILLLFSYCMCPRMCCCSVDMGGCTSALLRASQRTGPNPLLIQPPWFTFPTPSLYSLCSPPSQRFTESIRVPAFLCVYPSASVMSYYYSLPVSPKAGRPGRLFTVSIPAYQPSDLRECFRTMVH